MKTVLDFSRRRFLVLASALPAFLLLTRCAPFNRRDGYDDTRYSGPFFSDGTTFAE